MGAHRYIQELWRRKWSVVITLSLEVLCRQYRQLSTLHRATHPTQPDKARGL